MQENISNDVKNLIEEMENSKARAYLSQVQKGEKQQNPHLNLPTEADERFTLILDFDSSSKDQRDEVAKALLEGYMTRGKDSILANINLPNNWQTFVQAKSREMITEKTTEFSTTSRTRVTELDEKAQSLAPPVIGWGSFGSGMVLVTLGLMLAVAGVTVVVPLVLAVIGIVAVGVGIIALGVGMYNEHQARKEIDKRSSLAHEIGALKEFSGLGKEPAQVNVVEQVIYGKKIFLEPKMQPTVTPTDTPTDTSNITKST